MKFATRILAASALVATLAIAAPASAAVVSLNFEGIASYPNNNDVYIQDYYNGGTSSIGTSGTNYGVSFGSNALLICLNTVGTNCSNTSRGGVGDPASAKSGLFFLDGSQAFLNYSAGFTTGFSFNYSAISQGGTIGVYDGLNGTGNLLTSITLGTTPSSCPSQYNAAFCPFVAGGGAFSGTARSIGFGGVANQIVFDDITFGSTTPGSVPEPASWAMMILGMGAIGYTLRSAKRRSEAKFDAKIKAITFGATA